MTKSGTKKPGDEKYAAFLRGINVGGHHKVKMTDLKKMLEGLGLGDIRTVLASGNVLFSSKEKNINGLAKKIEIELTKAFGFSIPVMLRKVSDLEKIAKTDPFKGINLTKETRLYVTFLDRLAKTTLKIPYISPSKEFRILKVLGSEIFSVLVLTPELRTTDAMNILEKEFGTKICTTRNWNTVKKML